MFFLVLVPPSHSMFEWLHPFQRSFIPTSISYLQKSESIQPRTSLSKSGSDLEEIWKFEGGENPAQITNSRNLKCEPCGPFKVPKLSRRSAVHIASSPERPAKPQKYALFLPLNCCPRLGHMPCSMKRGKLSGFMWYETGRNRACADNP